jgi:orotate phosphoribosyltransferase
MEMKDDTSGVGCTLTEQCRTRHARLVELLKEHGFAKYRPERPFTLASGKKSPYYFNIKGALCVPDTRAYIAWFVTRWVQNWNPHSIGGPANAAYLLVGMGVDAAPLARASGFVVRKEAKKHGMESAIDGIEVVEGDRVVLLEDVITTGGSLLPTIKYVEDSGGILMQIIAVVDRAADGDAEADKLTKYREGSLVSSILTTKDIFPE